MNTKSRWELIGKHDASTIDEMAKNFRLPLSIAKVLLNRGLSTIEEVERFIKPNIKNLNDPFLLKDMDVAVDRLITAMREREKIMIYGDYDVDGITSVSVLYLFLKDLGGDVVFYIPDRAAEGYSLSEIGIDDAVKQGCAIIITVDCGITSIHESKYAKTKNIDLIVTDHHEPGDVLPEALAVVDPKQPDCGYPFKELAGVGVAYKLIQGLAKRLELDESYAEKYIDLVAIGSAADIVPLVEENRVLVKLGLKKLNTNGLKGIITLIESAGFVPGKIEVSQIVYGLAPRINAVGRLGHAAPAVDLLVTRNHNQAIQISHLLEEENKRRKQIDTITLNEALEKIDKEIDLVNSSVIILAAAKWHPGVIGIVASRIIERFYKPTVMITIDNGIGKGSARSIAGFDLHSALKKCADLFVQFGGHKYAAGLTIEEKNIPEFKKRFNKICSELLSVADQVRIIEIDDEIDIEDVDFELIRLINTLAPFGPRNACPLFVSYNLDVVGEPRIVGNNHLKFRVGKNGKVFDVIAFNLGDAIEQLREKRKVDIVYNIEENKWMDRNTIQFKVKDLR